MLTLIPCALVADTGPHSATIAIIAASRRPKTHKNINYYFPNPYKLTNLSVLKQNLVIKDQQLYYAYNSRLHSGNCNTPHATGLTEDPHVNITSKLENAVRDMFDPAYSYMSAPSSCTARLSNINPFSVIHIDHETSNKLVSHVEKIRVFRAQNTQSPLNVAINRLDWKKYFATIKDSIIASVYASGSGFYGFNFDDNPTAYNNFSAVISQLWQLDNLTDIVEDYSDILDSIYDTCDSPRHFAIDQGLNHRTTASLFFIFNILGISLRENCQHTRLSDIHNLNIKASVSDIEICWLLGGFDEQKEQKERCAILGARPVFDKCGTQLAPVPLNGLKALKDCIKENNRILVGLKRNNAYNCNSKTKPADILKLLKRAIDGFKPLNDSYVGCVAVDKITPSVNYNCAAEAVIFDNEKCIKIANVLLESDNSRFWSKITIYFCDKSPDKYIKTAIAIDSNDHSYNVNQIANRLLEVFGSKVAGKQVKVMLRNVPTSSLNCHTMKLENRARNFSNINNTVTFKYIKKLVKQEPVVIDVEDYTQVKETPKPVLSKYKTIKLTKDSLTRLDDIVGGISATSLSNSK